MLWFIYYLLITFPVFLSHVDVIGAKWVSEPEGVLEGNRAGSGCCVGYHPTLLRHGLWAGLHQNGEIASGKPDFTSKRSMVTFFSENNIY